MTQLAFWVMQDLLITCLIWSFSGLKLTFLWYKLAGIGSVKGVKKAILGIKWNDLTKEATKVLGIFYSYDKKSWTWKAFPKSRT